MTRCVKDAAADAKLLPPRVKDSNDSEEDSAEGEYDSEIGRGMITCKLIVEELGGEIQVCKLEENQTTIFEVLLPMRS